MTDATFSLIIKSDYLLIRQRSGLPAQRLILQHRLSGHAVDLVSVNRKEWKLIPTDIDWQPTYWDVYAYFDDPLVMVRARLTRLWYLRGILQRLVILERDARSVYAYSAKNGGLSFSYRQNHGFSNQHNRLQYVALLAAFIMNILWPFKRPWLIFEKRSMRAQDAGFEFFKYLRSNQQTQSAYFLLDATSPDFARVQEYADHLVTFGSFKHLYLLHRAKLYVSSETNGHAYFWRHNTGIVSHLVRIHPSIFLQHGVLGFKKLDNFFQVDSLSAPLLFITSSEFEQSIVETHLSYPRNRIPITGLARWDSVQVSPMNQRNVVLFFYTWRPWLDDVSLEVLKVSDYYKHIVAQVTSSSLQTWVKRSDKKIVIVLHPKVAELFPDKHIDNVTILGDVDIQLRELMERVAVLITDYSSLAWEAYYRDIPVIFDRFDIERYQKAVGMYLTSEKMPFGEVLTTDLSYQLSCLVEREWMLLPKDVKNKTTFFQFQDSHNSERVYEAIKNLSPGIWWRWRLQLIKKIGKYLK